MHMFGIMLAGAKPVAWPGTDISANKISEEGYVLKLDESNHYGKDYYSINIGLGLYLEYACQNEIITTNTNAGSSEGGV